MNILISGGVKNGKSFHAQEVARDMSKEQSCPLYYLATMIPRDEEDHARIRRHIRERAGWGFETVERGRDILGALDILSAEGNPVDPGGVFLLDSVTALLSNEMFLDDGSMDPDAGKRLETELAEFAQRTGNTVFVTDYIYSDPRFFDETTELYRRSLAGIDRALARVCDQVIEVSYGFKNYYK